jgi:hypothetical protein
MITEADVREQLEPYGEISDINVILIVQQLEINLFISYSIFLHVVVHLFVLKNVQMHQDVWKR